MDRFPPLDRVLESIEVLKKEIWPKFEDFQNVREFNEYFHQKFSLHFNMRMIYAPCTPLNNLELKFYRVRALDEIRDPSSIREYSYPLPEQCRQNRANLPGFPVFYSSPNPSVALLETIRNSNRENNGRQYCISMWTIANRRKFIVSPFVHNVDDEGYANLSKLILNDKLPKSLKGSHLENDAATFRAIIEFLSNSFVSDHEGTYSISSFIGHAHIYMPNEMRTDFFMYPSIESDKRAINIAVNPTTVNEHLELKYVLISEVDFDLANDKLRLSSSEFGVSNGKTVAFKPVGTSDNNLNPEYAQIYKQFSSTL